MPAFNGNWVDAAVLLVLLYFATEAWRRGFVGILADFVSFLGSLLAALRLYKFAAGFLETNFTMAHSLANALGFFITAVVLEAVFGYLLAKIIARLPQKVWEHRLNKALGIIPALGEGIILIAFFLTLLMGLPIRPGVKEDVAGSRIGGAILARTSGMEKSLNDIFGGVIEDSLTYFTVKPGSRESIPLTIGKETLTVDSASEEGMFKMVNDERQKAAVAPLTWAPEIVPVARAHAMDMWQRKYFSHYSPEGRDVGDRLTEAGVRYILAGENLALAPTLTTAMTGFMNSPGHKANILEPKFHKVGIGVIDNGYYGKMFVQVFTN